MRVGRIVDRVPGFYRVADRALYWSMIWRTAEERYKVLAFWDRHGLAAEALKPGRFVVHRQRVPIRVVLIGFEEEQVDEDVLRSWLPRTYRLLVRYPQYYGLE